MKKFPLSLLFIFLSLAYGYAQDKSKTEIQFLDPPAPNTVPFSGAVRVGNMLYLSGVIGIDKATRKPIVGGIEAETKQAMEDMKATLERNGSDLDHVVKCTVFLADIKDWPKMTEVYKKYFTKHFPARSAVAGSGLALDARVEIECIAVIRE
jgi:2-iminobutanoate/2-iminopropanoate deaminase